MRLQDNGLLLTFLSFVRARHMVTTRSSARRTGQLQSQPTYILYSSWTRLPSIIKKQLKRMNGEHSAITNCERKVGQAFIMGLMQDTPGRVFLIASDEACNVLGFLVGQIYPGREVYVDLICSRYRLGQAILLQFMIWVLAQGADFISLNALLQVVSYYAQFGFSRTPNQCAKDPELDNLARDEAWDSVNMDGKKVAWNAFEATRAGNPLNEQDGLVSEIRKTMDKFLQKKRQELDQGKPVDDTFEAWMKETLGGLYPNNSISGGIKMSRCLANGWSRVDEFLSRYPEFDPPSIVDWDTCTAAPDSYVFPGAIYQDIRALKAALAPETLPSGFH